MNFTDHIIEERVQVALQHQYRMALGHPATGQGMGPEERAQFLRRAFAAIAEGMGVDRFVQTPVERLDQFAVMSVCKNHDTAGLLRSLVNSFMIAYACPETADRAFAALVEIEGLRALVADGKGHGQMSNKPELVAAARALQGRLQLRHGREGIKFRVNIGADRLYVVSDKPMEGLPQEFQGFPVQFMRG